MTYQNLAQFSIKFAITVMVLLFGWLFYHQLMAGMDMESMPDCAAFCFVATHVDVLDLTQSLYYSFGSILHNASALLLLSVGSVLAAWILLDIQFGVSPPLVRLQSYYHNQRWKLQRFALWSRLLAQGIIAPQLYS